MMETKDTLLAEYRALENIPSGGEHAAAYRKFKSAILTNQDALYDLIFSGLVADMRELGELILFGASGSTDKTENIHWIPFFKRVYKRKDELPGTLPMMLDHYANEFGWVEQ